MSSGTRKGVALPAELKRRRVGGTGTPEVELEHVRRVYDSIASQWHGTRYKAWPQVEAFVQSKPRGTLFADLGCGNGKNMPACDAAGLAVGSDVSLELVKIAQSRGLEALAADVVALPYRAAAFDCALCIAVLHHISTPERRLRAIAEAMRVVRVGGDALFYAWALEQTRPPDAKLANEGAETQGRSGHRFDEADVLVPFSCKRPRPPKGELKSEHAKEEQQRKDAEAAAEELKGFAASHARFDAEKNAFTFQRYCHVYAAGELQALAAQLEPHVVVERVYWDTGNWAMVLRKVSAPPGER